MPRSRLCVLLALDSVAAVAADAAAAHARLLGIISVHAATIKAETRAASARRIALSSSSSPPPPPGALPATSRARLALEHALVHTTHFDGTAFRVGDGTRRAGLTTSLALAFIVPRHSPLTCHSCQGTRATTLVAGTGTGFAPRAHARVCAGASPIAHGALVDAQLAEYAADAGAFVERYGRAGADPCVYAVLEYVHERRGWTIVAAQVPLAVPSLNVATAIDLVCTDTATRTELHVLEIKASANSPAGWGVYEHAASAYGRTGALATVPRSRYALHQLQLWAMWRGLTRDARLDVTSATVVRVSPTELMAYPLHEWFRTNDALVAARMRTRLRATPAGQAGARTRRAAAGVRKAARARKRQRL